jgi:hypothetical protein
MTLGGPFQDWEEWVVSDPLGLENVEVRKKRHLVECRFAKVNCPPA